MAADYVLTILKRGLKRIEAGWTKGDFKRKIDGKDHYCTIGAIDHDYEAMDALRDVTKAIWLATWNDKPSRTKAQVVAAFKKAIARRIKAVI